MTSVQASQSRVPLYLSLLVALHIAIVIASNYLVQLPITLLGFHSTWGAFSFPFIFLATDLTVRLIGKASARHVVARAMLPGGWRPRRHRCLARRWTRRPFSRLRSGTAQMPSWRRIGSRLPGWTTPSSSV